MLHICTTESLRAGIDEPAIECNVCGRKTMFLDYCGFRCDTCGADTAWDGDLAGFVRTIRRKTKLTRKQISDKAGLKPATVKNYEWIHPSKKYFNWFKGFIKNHYAQLGDAGIIARDEADIEHDRKIIEEWKTSL